MSKIQIKKKPTVSPKNISSKVKKNIDTIDSNLLLQKYFWIVIPVFTLIYYLSCKYSVGFYQDDEVGQYINMINFWNDPFAILGNSPKPGYKIFLVIPSLFGYETVLFVNSLIASLSVYFTYVLLRVYKINYAFFGALLLSVQPLFFDLSFRSYAEIFTSLLILIVLILYRKEMYFLSGLVCGYIFTVRQEIALLIIIFAYIFFKRKNYFAILALTIFPLLYNVLGYVKTGDILFVLSEMQALSVYGYKTQGISHYFFVYIFIVGPVTLLLFFCGFFGFLGNTKNLKTYISEYGIFYFVFTTIFSVQLMTMFSDGANPGNWRYLLHISPVAAVFATIGLNNLGKKEFRNTAYILIGALALITLAFFSKTTDGFILLDVSDYTKFFMIAISLVLILLISKESVNDYLNKLSALLIILAIINLYLSFTPKKLSPENVALKQTSEYLNSLDLNGKDIYFNHTFVPFYNDKYYRQSPNNFKRLISENIKDAKPGSILIWDSHYSYRPKDMKNDIPIDRLQNDSGYKLINQIPSADKRFVAYIFEKTN